MKQNKAPGKKIFISYKYKDSQVEKLDDNTNTTCRNYVDELQLEETPYIFKAEDDDNDLSKFKNNKIASTLRDKIFDSSVTLVLISKGMKTTKPEEDQWIPWEISYSLSEYKRNNRKSLTNGVLAIVIPDKNGSYEYMIKEDGTICKEKLFKIIKENMFNKKPTDRKCNGRKIHTGGHSYIPIVKWVDFMECKNRYIDESSTLNDNIDDYEITKSV